MAEYVVKPDYTMVSKESHGSIYKWNFGTDTEPERIVRCRDCGHRLPKGWKMNERSNEAGGDACGLHSPHDFDLDFTNFFYIDPDDYCSRGYDARQQRNNLRNNAADDDNRGRFSA